MSLLEPDIMAVVNFLIFSLKQGNIIKCETIEKQPKEENRRDTIVRSITLSNFDSKNKSKKLMKNKMI